MGRTTRQRKATTRVASSSGRRQRRTTVSNAKPTTTTKRVAAAAKKKAAKKPKPAPKPKGKSKNARGKNSSKQQQKKEPRESSSYILDEETGEKIWITQATKREIDIGEKTRSCPFTARNRKFLLHVPSQQCREVVYEEAACAWEHLETRILPTYGNRPWKVLVKVTDPSPSGDGNNKKKTTKKKGAKTPYFRFFRGRLELAAWPHLVANKIPEPPKFPGYYVNTENAIRSRRKQRQQQKQLEKKERGEESDEEEEEEASSGDGDEGSNCVDANVESGEEPGRGVNISDKEGGEEGEKHEGEEEEEEEEEESESEEESDGSDDEDEGGDSEEWRRIYSLQERECTSLTNAAWEQRSMVPLPQIQIKWVSPCSQQLSLTSRVRGWDHAVTLCRNELVINKVLCGQGSNGQELMVQSFPRKLVFQAGKLRFERDGLWVVGQEEEWQISKLQADGYMDEDQEWNAQLAAEEAKEAKEATKNPAASSVPAKEGAGEEDRKKKKARTSDSSGGSNNNNKRRFTGLLFYIKSSRRQHQKGRLKELNDGAGSEKVSFTLAQADQELRQLWKTSLDDNERREWEEGARRVEQQQQAKEKGSVLKQPPIAPAAAAQSTPKAEVAAAGSAAVVSPDDTSRDDDSDGTDHDHNLHSHNDDSPTSPTPPSKLQPLNLFAGDSPRVKEKKTGSASNKAKYTSASLEDLQSSLQNHVSATIRDSMSSSSSSSRKRPPNQPKSAPSLASLKKKFTIASNTWRLKDDQMKLCYDAGMDHYDQIMLTVKQRDLHRELQDGFDLLRERGRGRYDMTIPAFENDAKTFNFLTDPKKTPWMPIVREIFDNDDVVLIHKGMFMSMPGADQQVYHQDGVHLSRQYQRPVHAVNVFVPLVDLTMELGPTEFCLGTHILGNEDFNREFIETPVVKAGTPIIFDYRLGHRGLANTGRICRPIVYCTYARASNSNSKEFRDSVNFSNKRYHKIGDLVEKALTREERAKKRRELIEERLEPAVDE